MEFAGMGSSLMKMKFKEYYNEAFSSGAAGFIGKVIEVKLKDGKSMIEAINADKVDNIRHVRITFVDIKDVTKSEFGHPHYMVDSKVKLKRDQIIRVVKRS